MFTGLSSPSLYHLSGSWGWLLLPLFLLAGSRLEAARSAQEAPASKIKKSDRAAAFFADRTVRLFEIELSDAAMASLRLNPRTHVSGTVREGGQVFTNVGLHIKGMGSFRPLDDKPSFVVKFNAFVPSQEYCGLSKLMLNNSVQDQTYVCELLGTGLFRDAGVPAARVTHARVTLNGRDLGLHVAIEAMNKHFLKRHFTDTSGNLYDGYLCDVDRPLNQSNGDDTSQADVRRLLAACRTPDLAQRFERLSKVLDVDRFVSFAVMEVLINHWDGYTLKANNYRCYHDPATDRFVFIPYGMDSIFRRLNIAVRAPTRSVVGRALFETPEGKRLYEERLRLFATNVFVYTTITNRMEDALAKLRAARVPGLNMVEIDRQAAAMRLRLVHRMTRVHDELAGHPPPVLKFDAAGLGRPEGWRDEYDRGTPAMDRVTVDGKACLHIEARGGRCRASWRAMVNLAPGRYLFEGQVRAIGLVNGYTSLRISGDTRSLRLTQPASWQRLQHPFLLPEGGDAELVCELVAEGGEVWFDLDSLRLRQW
jgi:spore coat protein H